MINVVVANLSNIEAIYELEKSLFVGESYSLQSLQEELTNKNRVYLVAINKAGEVAGYLGANITSDFAEIMKIGVSNNYQRQGIAKIMFLKFTEIVKNLGLPEISLEVDNKNNKAILFYQSMGFKQVYTRKNYYKNGNDAIIYSVKL